MIKSNHSTMNIDALFLGTKSENATFFKEMMDYAISEHMHWRSGFHPEDPTLVTAVDRHTPSYRGTLYRTEMILNQLSSKLKIASVPAFSPHYMGHMCADTLMIANIAYMMTMMYNQNNCAEELSPMTTSLELDVAEDLCRMFGFDTHISWGHLTSGGSIANYEGLWVARNLKTLPLAMEAHPKARLLLNSQNNKSSQNRATSDILNLVDELKKQNLFEEVRALTCRGVGVEPRQLGKLVVSQSKHYSWSKGMDVLGIGQENIVQLPVNEKYQIDVNKMREIILDLIERDEPILAVVAVVGTTEVGSIDNVAELIALRNECEQRYGASFYIHVDAAYGGYASSLFLDQQGKFIEYDKLINYYHDEGIFPSDIIWPTPEVYQSYSALREVDSITVDPHKMGYIPYCAGAVCMKDKRIVDLISYHAEYVFEKVNLNNDNSQRKTLSLGPSIMEGSKPGAVAAAVWAAHRLLPLNTQGYGRVIAAGITTAHWLIDKLNNTASFKIADRSFKIYAMPFFDTQIINFIFKEEANEDLAANNRLNKYLYKTCSFAEGHVYSNDFIISSTLLTHKSYGDTPANFCQQAKFSFAEWQRVKSLYILRSTIMTHCLHDRAHFEAYWQSLEAVFSRKLQQWVDEENRLAHLTQKESA